jgi:type IV secretory pathway protease TraF
MRRTLLGLTLSLTGAVGLVLVLAMVSHALTGRRFYYNGGVSLAPGWYACTPVAPDAALAPGALVQIVPTVEERAVVQALAPTELRTEFWMKRLVAQAGQTVCFEGDDVRLAGVVIAQRPLLRDYPLAHVEGCMVLGGDDVLVLGDHARSYDARYGGPWSRTAVRGTCEPLWTWETK